MLKVSSDEKRGPALQTCITCGAALHPERALKYSYCMSPECQEKNAKGLTMVAVGVNKSAEQYLILDEKTKADLAGGRDHDQRRGTFGTSPAAAPSAPPTNPASSRGTAPEKPTPAANQPRSHSRPEATPTRRPAPRRPWSLRQQKLALLYNEQGLRPDEIAAKLGLSQYIV